jgi:hypothetical protein
MRGNAGTRPYHYFVTEEGAAVLDALCRIRRSGVVCDQPLGHKSDHEGTEEISTGVPHGRHGVRRRWSR